MTDAPINSTTQEERILRVLQRVPGRWVPLPEILALGCAQYNARIKGLREKGYVIESKVEHKGAQRHSWFRLVPNEQGRLF